MSTSLSEGLPESLKSLRTRSLFLLREQVPPLLVVGQTPNAFRRVGLVQGGSFEGERLSGEVVNGNDWQSVRPTPASSWTCVWCCAPTMEP